MTTWGGKLAGIDSEQLRQQLRTESDPKAIKRLTSALLYEHGHSPAEIERLLGFPEQTVYDWLDTVAERDPDALGDLPRPGQSTGLTDKQWTDLTATLAQAAGSGRLRRASVDAPTRARVHCRDLRRQVLAGAHVPRNEAGGPVLPDRPTAPLQGRSGSATPVARGL